MRPWEANIRRVVPYVPGDQPKGSRLIKLNTNENPYPPAPGVARALREMDPEAFRKYPDHLPPAWWRRWPPGTGWTRSASSWAWARTM